MSFWRGELLKVVADLKKRQPLAANLTSWAAVTRAAGLDAFVATPSSAGLAALLTDETGTGAAVFANSPALAGTPTAPTAAVDTNTTQLATTAMVLGQASAVAPLGNLAAAVIGTSTRFARADHVHPGREVLTANRTYYVRTDGSDSNMGLADTSGGAFLTIQKAIDVTKAIDLAGFNVTIQVRSGTYTGSINANVPWLGGNVTLTGDTTTPGNCIISHSAFGAFTVTNAVVLSIQGFQIQNNAASALGNGILATNNAIVNISGNVTFAACTRAHMEVNSGSTVNVNSGYTISGNTNYHWLLNYGALVLSGQTITLSGTPAWGVTYVDASNGAGATVFNATFSGAATGKRYNGTLNAVINTFGGGATYFPGSVAGTTATGGQYA